VAGVVEGLDLSTLFGRLRLMDTNDLIYGVLMRPRMHLPHIWTVRDLLMFVAGVNCGLHPPHGGNMLPSFEHYLKERLPSTTSRPEEPFTLSALAQKPVEELCERIAELYKEWLASGESPE
jgi:hypothetical protein